MHFYRKVLADIHEDLPRLRRMEESVYATEADFDVLIVVNGFEVRSTKLVERLADAGAHAGTVIVFRFSTNQEDNDRTAALLFDRAAALSENIHEIFFGDPEFEVSRELASLVEAAASADRRTRVLFDVSGASGRMILRTIRTLFELVRLKGLDIELTLSYTEAANYRPTRSEADDYIRRAKQKDMGATLGLDFDAETPTPSVEYAGQHIDHAPDRAIVICGFNAERARSALDNIDSAFNVEMPHARVTYIVGEPPAAELAWRRDAMMEINAIGVDPSSISYSFTSTLEFTETLAFLERQYELHFGRERITILPFGSKMQTLAVALFCEIHGDVRVQSIAPSRYAGDAYSSGTSNEWFVEFGALADVVDALSSIGQIEPRQ